MSEHRPQSPRRSLSRASLMVAAALLGVAVSTAPKAKAANLYWDADGSAATNTTSGTGLGGAATWNATQVNWWDGAAATDQAWSNSTADTAIFKGTAGRVILGSNVSAGTLQFDTANYVIDLSTFSLTLQSGVTANEIATIRSGTLTLGANNIWNVASAKTLTVSSVVSDGVNSFSIEKSGAGSLTLSGANTFDGGVTLTAGTLNIASASALGTGTFVISGGTIDNTSGAALTLSTNNVQTWGGDFTFTGTGNLNLGTGAVTLGASRTVTVTANTLTVGGIIGDGSNGYALTKAGAGTLVLSGSNTYSGGTTLSAGTLNINNAGALGAGTFIINGGTIDNTSGASITLSSNNAQTWGANLTFTGTSNLNLGTGAVTLGASRTVTVTANTLTVGGIISDGANGYLLTKAGAGTLVLSGSNTYSGGTTLSAGTLLASNAGALGSAGNITFSGGTLQYAPGITTDLSSRIKNSGSAIVINTSFQTVTFASALDSTNTGGLTKAGDGSLTLTTANAFTGSTTVNAGSLTITNGGALGAGAVSVVGTNSAGVSGGRLVLGGTLASGLTVANNLTLAGSGGGVGSINTNANGTLVSIGNNTLTGTLTTSTSYDSQISSTFGTLTLSSSSITLGAGKTVTFGGQGVIVQGTNAFNVSGTTTALIEKRGTSTLVLNNANNAFSGIVTVSVGFLRANSGGALGTSTNSGAITLNTGTLELRVASADVGSFSTKKLYVGADSSLFVDHAVGTTEINQIIDLADYSTNTRALTINGRNGYQFSTGVNAATITATGARNATFTTGTVNGLVTIDGNFTIGESTGSRLMLFTTAGDAVFNGMLVKGAGALADGLQKAGTGTLTWNAGASSSTVTGAVNINAGTVAISNLANSIGAMSGITFGNTTVGAALNYTGVGESSSKIITLSATTGPTFIFANQSTATNPLILSNFSGSLGAGGKFLVLGGRDTQANEISAILADSTSTTSVTKVGAGNWTLSAANTATGVLTVAGGKLTLKASASGATDIFKATGAVTFNADGVTALSGHLGTQSAGGILQFDGFTGGSQEALGALTATAGHGQVVIGGTTTLSTLTFASLGTRSAGATLNLAPGGTSGIIFTTATSNSNGLIGGYATYGVNGTEFAANVAAAGTAAAYTAASTLVAASNAATTNFKLTTGTVTLTTANASVNSLKLEGSAGGTTVGLNGIMTVTSLGVLFDNTNGNATISGGTQLGAAASEVIITTNGTGSGILTVSSAISSTTGSLTKAGSGTLVLSGASAFTGNVNINQGTVQLSGASGRIGTSQVAATVFNLRQGATFDLNGAGGGSTTIGALNGAGSIINSGTSTLVIGNGATTTVANAAFTGTLGSAGLSLTKEGTGVQYLTGANTYGGVTTINRGTLAVTSLASGGNTSSIGNSSSSAANLVFNGGTLQYTGSNAVVVQATQTPSVSIDRLFTLTASGGTIDSSGTFGNSFLATGVANNATLIFSGTGDIAFSGNGNRTLTLLGSSTGDNTLTPRLIDPVSQASPVVTGTLALTKAGAGLWILNPSTSNTYTGATTVNGSGATASGVLQFADDSGAVKGISTGSNILLGNATGPGVLQSSGSFVRATGTGANQIQFGSFGGGFAASSSKLTVNLGGAAASLVLGTAPLATSLLVLSSSTALAEVELANGLDLGSAARTVQVDDNTNTSTDYAILSGKITGIAGGTFTKTGSGNLVLTNATSDYVANTQVSAGTLTLTNIDGAGGTSNLGTNAGKLILGAAGTTAVTLNYVGAGATVIRAIDLNTTTGGITIDSSGYGALALNGTLTTAAAGAKTLTLSGSNADLNTVGSVIADNGGALSISKTGGGTWVLSGANTFTGNASATNGILGVGADSVGTAGSVTSGPLGRGTLDLGTNATGKGGLMAVGADRTILNTVSQTAGTTSGGNFFMGDYSLTFSGSFAAAKGASAGLTNNITATGKVVTFSGATTIGDGTTARTFTVDGTGITRLNGNITNFASALHALTYAGTGSLTLGGTNTYTGVTTLTSGTLNFANSGALNGAGGFIITAGTIDNTSGAGMTLANNALTLNGNFTFTGTNDLNLGTGATSISAGRTITVTAGTLTLGGAITGATFNITKAGAGTLYLTGANSLMTGTVATINAGTLKIDNELNLGPVTNDVTWGGVGTLQVTTGFAADAGKVFTIGANTGTIQVDTGTLTIASAVVSTVTTGTLVKSGSGNLSLTVASTALDGTLRVDAGNLVVNGVANVLGDTTNRVPLRLNGGNLVITSDTAGTFNNATWLDAVSSTITLNRAVAGAGVTHTMSGATLTVGALGATLNVVGGSNIDASSTAGLTFGAVTLSGPATFNISNPTSATTLLTIGAVTTSTANSISVTGNGNFTAGGVVGGTGGTVNLGVAGNGTAFSGTATFTGANTFTGGVFVNSGTAVANVSNATTVSGAFGPSTVAVRLGDSSGSNSASILANTFTVSNPITVVSGSTGNTLTIGNNGTNTDATFSGAITLANNLTISATGTTGSTTVSGSSITGIGNLTLNAIKSSVATGITLSATSINNIGTITNSGASGAASTLISGIIGTNVTGVIQNSATSWLRMSGQANLWNTGLTIKAGTVSAGNDNNTFGANNNVITLGDSSGSSDATLYVSPTAGRTFAQSIIVAAGSTGALTIVDDYGTTGVATFNGAVTVNNNVILSKIGASTGNMIFTGGFSTSSGTGKNITIQNNGLPASGGLIVLSGTAVNNTGAIINNGTGTAGVTISADIGTSVTNLTQNSATSALTLSGTTIGFTGALAVSAGTLNITGSSAAVITPSALTVAGGATFNTVNTVGQTIALGAGALNLGSGSGTATLGFELGNGSNYDRVTSSAAAVTANAVVLNLTGLAGLTAGVNYDLITAASGLAGSTYSIAATGVSGYSLALSTNATYVRVVATAATGAHYWDGTLGATTSWSALTGAISNWSSDFAGSTNTGSTPGSASSVIFSSDDITGTALTTTLDAAFAIKDLTFNDQVGAAGPLGTITINSGTGGTASTLTITPGDPSNGINIQTGAPATITIGAPIVLGAAQTWTVTDSATVLTASGAVSGSFGLTKSGAGILILSGSNTFTNGLAINGGSVRLSNAGALNSTTPQAVSFGATSNGVLQLFNQAAITLSGLSGDSTAFVENGGATTNSVLTVNKSSGSDTFAGVLRNGSTSTLALTKSGAGTLVLGGNNTYTGATTINAGTLQLNAATNALLTTTVVTLANSTEVATLNLNGNAQTIASLTIGGASGGAATQGIVNLGTGGTLTFGGNVTFTSTGNSTATQQINGGTLDLGGATRTFTIGNSTGASNDMEISSVIQNGAFTKAGLGKLVLSGNNTFTGTVTLGTGAGELVITKSGGLGVGPKTISLIDNTTGNSASVQLDGTSGNITLDANLSWTTSSNNGTGGILNIAGDNTINGNFTLTGGGGSTTFTVNGGSLNLAGTLAPNTTGRFVILNGTNNGTVSGVMQDGSPTNYLGVQKLGTGTWTITGANTYIGNTQIKEGSLRVAGADNRILSTGAGTNFSVILGALATSGKLILGGDSAGGTGAGTQRNQTLTQNSATNVLTISGTGTGNSVVGGADGGTSAGTPDNNSTLTLNIGAGLTDTYAGLIGWDGVGSVGFQNNINLTKSGGGTLILNGDLSYWTGTSSGPTDSTRPQLNLSAGVLTLNGTINTSIVNYGGLLIDNSVHGANFSLTTLGGLVSFDTASDSFSSNSLVAASHGVASLNFANNTVVTDYASSDMYLGASGARSFAGTSLSAGASNTYRFGGGSPWSQPSSASLTGSGGYLQVANTVVVGANNVIIGDNGSYNAGGSIFGRNSTVEFRSSQSYTGTTTLAGGSLIVSNTNQLGVPATTAGSIILDGGIFRYSGITTDISNRLTIDSGGTIDTNGQIVTFASAIGNSDTGTSDVTSHPTTNAVGGLTKIGAGTLTLTAANTYAGTTTVNGGILQLNRQTGSLVSTSALTFGGGGTFNLDNVGATGTLSQTMGVLTFSAGDGVILSTRTAAQSTNLTFASLASRVAGATGNITLGGTSPTSAINKVIFTAAPTAAQFINPGLYVSGTSFAAYDVAGYVRAFAYGTDKDSTGTYTSFTTGASAAGLTASATNADTQITGAITNQGTQIISSLKIGGAYALTQTASTTLTISSGGLIKTGATATISGGTLSTAGAEFVVRVDGSDALTISSSISAAGGLTKSGTGTLTLSTGTNSFGNLPITINGGTLSVDSESRFGTAGTDYSSILLNGGNLTITGNSTVNGPFALGLGGGTITHNYGTGDNNIGVAGVDLLLPGSGSRTLTLAGVVDRQKVFRFNIGDNGGPTNVNIFSSGDGHVITLTANNTYTGTTTITRGVLRLGSTGALPGGLGGTSLSTSNTGGGNLIFAATGTLPTNNRAVLELNATVGDFYRAVGTGFDQVSWTGHGGFSVSDGSVRTVNLGGSGAQLTWGSGGFVPAGSALQFGQSASNVGFNGTVDFKNDIALGGAVRTIDVANGALAQDAILSGNITATAGGALTKQGLGALRLNGVNNTGAFTVNVTGGPLYFEDASAVLGASGTITVTATATSPASIGLGGSTNPLTDFGSRLAPASNGAFTLDVNSSENFDFSTFIAPNMRLTAFNPANTAVYYYGTITPSSATYRFGGGPSAQAGANSPSTTLVLNIQNALTGARSVNLAPGNLTLLQTQDYSGGTSINSTIAGGSSAVGVGSDAAFGSGTITLSTAANTISFGSVNGDRVVPNQILNQQPSANAFVAGADYTTDGISNNSAQGATTYTGTLDLNARSGVAILYSRTNHAALFLGNISNGTGGLTLSSTTAGLFGFLTNGGASKGFSGTVTLSDNSNLYIDGNGSLGTGTSGVTIGTSLLALQPGTGTVTLTSRAITITSDKLPRFMVYSGGNLVSTSGISSPNSMTASRTLTKSGAGTLTLQGKNGTWAGVGSYTNTLQIQGGKVVLDATAATFTAASDRFLTETVALPLTFGAASATLGGGGTLEMVQYSGNANALTQAFGGTLTINQGAHTLKITNNDATAAANLNLGSTFTRTTLTGGTMNFASTTLGGANTFGTSNVGTNGIIGGWATFNGVDWATGSGTAITALNSYTTLPTSGSTLTVNYSLATNATTTLTANQSINSLKLAPTGASQILALGATTLTNTSGGIIFDNTSGATTISGTGQIGASGSEVIVHTAGSGSGKLTLNAVVKGTNTVLTKSGAGTLVLAGSNTYTGALIINAGTVEYSSATTTTNLGAPTAAAANIILNGGTLSYTGATSNTLSFGITVNSQSTINVADVAGTLLFNPTAFGIIGVASTNTIGFSATTGILQKTGAGALTIQGGLANVNLSVQVTAGTVNLAKTGTFLAVGEGTNASGMPYAALIVNNNAAAKITGAGTDQIGNASSVVIQGTGYLDVNGSGSTSVTESFDGLAGNGIVKNTGASAFTLTLGSNNSSGISAYTVGAAHAAMLAGDNNINVRGLNHFAGIIQDNIALTKTGSGTQILSGANTYSGATTISAGTLKLGAANVLPSGSSKGDVTIVGNGTGALLGGAANIIAPGTLDMGGFSQAINGLNSSTGGFVTSNPSSDANASSTLTLGNNDASSAFNGVIMNGYRVGANSTTATPLAYVGTIALTKTGTGSLTLSGANTYTGDTTLTSGALRAGISNAFGTSLLNLNAGTLTSDGATARAFTNNVIIGGNIALGETTTYTGGLTFSGTVGLGGSVRTLTTDSDVTFAGIVSNGGLNKAGNAALTLSGDNSFSGGTTISAGTVRAGHANAFGNLATHTLVLNGGTLTSDGATARAFANNVTIGGNITLGADSAYTGALTFNGTVGLGSTVRTLTVNSAVTFAGIVSNGGLTKAGNGALTLSGDNAFSGGTTVSAGTVRAGHNNAFGSLAANTLALNGGTLTSDGATARAFANNVTVGGNITLGATTTNTGVLTFNGTVGLGAATRTLTVDSDVTLAGIVSNGGLTKAGNGTLTLSGANDFTGATSVTAGTLATSGDGRLATTSGITVDSTTTLSLGGDETINSLANSGTVTIASGKTLTTGSSSYSLAGTVSGAGNLTKAGVGTLTLSSGGTFSYAGLTTVTNGTLAYGADDQLGNSNAITVDGGILAFGGFSDTVGAVTLTSGSITGTTGVLTATSVTSDTTTTATLSAKLGGATTLAMTGAGVLTLSGDNSFSGGTTISAGTVRAGHNNAFGSLAANTLALNGGTLTSDGATARAFANNVTVGGNITLGATTTNTGVLTFSGAVGLGSSAARTITANSAVTFTGGVTSTNQNLTIGGAGDVTISTLALNLGTGTLTMNGTGTLLLSVANTFAGATINSGTIRIGNAGSLGGGTISVGAAGTLDLNSYAVTNAITLAAGATLTGGSLGASTAPTIGTVESVLTGTTLTKTDIGRLELTGANTYTGVTSVANVGAVLAVADFGNGSTASPLGINALDNPANLIIGGGATLEFTGATNTTTARSFTIADSGTISATGTGALNFNSSSKIKFTGATQALTLSATSTTAVNRFASVLDGTDAISTLTIDGVGIWVIGSSATNRFKNTASISIAAGVGVNQGATLGFDSGSLGNSADSAINIGNNAVLRWSADNVDDISGRLRIGTGHTAKLDIGGNDVVFASAPKNAAGAAITAGTIEKKGAGTLQVTFSSPDLEFNVPTGKLTVNGTVGNVNLTSSGTILGGSGTVGNVIMVNGAEISPGNSPGNINMASLTVAASNIINWQVQDALDFTEPRGFDTIHIAGNLNLNAIDNSSKRIVIKVASLLGNGNGTTLGKPLNFNNPDTPGMAPRTFDFIQVRSITYNETTGSNITDYFTFNLDGFQYTNDGPNNLGLWSISSEVRGADTYIMITAVPEPSTYGFGLGALALAAAAIRRRRKNQPTKA